MRLALFKLSNMSNMVKPHINLGRDHHNPAAGGVAAGVWWCPVGSFFKLSNMTNTRINLERHHHNPAAGGVAAGVRWCRRRIVVVFFHGVFSD